MAYDELSVAYNTRVLRAKNIEGPYYGKDGRDCTNKGGEAYPILTHPYKFNNSPGWVGISHCAVFDDGEGNWYFSSQGRLPAGVNGNPYSNALMMGQVRSIRWTQDGWPVIMPERYGDVPQLTILESELKGTWENITLEYNLGQQCTSESMTLGSGHKITAMLHPKISNGIAHRITGYFSKRMTTHTVADNTHEPINFWQIYDLEGILVISPSASFANCCMSYLHIIFS